MRFSAILALFISIGAAFATEGSGTNIYIGSNPTGFGYVEVLPVGYGANPKRPYPLVIFCNGSGEFGDGTSGSSGLTLLHNSGTGLVYNLEHGLSLGAVVLAPQDSGGSFNAAAYEGFIRYACLTYHVDAGKICLTGLSAGAGHVWRYLIAHPTPSSCAWPVVACAVPIAAPDYPYNDGAHFTYPYTGDITVPHFDSGAYKVWAHHDIDDSQVPWKRHCRWLDSYAATTTVANGWTSGNMSTTWSGSAWTWSSGTSSPSTFGLTVYPTGDHSGAWTTAYPASSTWTWVNSQALSTACANVIVDNTAATFVGTWNASTYYSGYYSTDYKSADPSQNATATYTPTLPKTARYRLFAHYPSYPAGTRWMQCDVYAGDGTAVTETVAFNEADPLATNVTWKYLGEWTMNSGTSCKAVLKTASSSSYLAADALMWEESPYLGVVLDNADTFCLTKTGTWATLTYLSGYYAGDYLSSDPGTGTHEERKAIFKTHLNRSGYYKWEIWYPTGNSTRGTAVMTIRKTGGATIRTASVDERSGGNAWLDLGTNYVAIADGGEDVEVEWKHPANAAGYVSADAVRITETAGIPPVDLYVDDTDPLRITTTGTWVSSTVLETGHETDPTYAFYGTDFLSAAPAASTTCTFTPNVAENTYVLYLRWPCKASRGVITVDVVSAGTNVLHTTYDESTVGDWIRIGGSTATYNLAPGSTYYLKITAPTSGGYVAADCLHVIEQALVSGG